jgi:hypothetical protein
MAGDIVLHRSSLLQFDQQSQQEVVGVRLVVTPQEGIHIGDL